MNKVWSKMNAAASKSLPNSWERSSRYARLCLTTALGAALVLSPPANMPRAQQQRFKEPSVKVTGIASNGGVVSITADGPLTRAQTYQANGKFYVVLVNGESDLGAGAPRGVRVGRVGSSLELVIPVKPGASVTVQPRGNRLDLVMSGGGAAVAEEAPRGADPEEVSPRPVRTPRERAPQVDTERAVPVTTRRRVLTGDSPLPQREEPVMPAVPAAAGAAPSNVQAVDLPVVASATSGGNPPPDAGKPVDTMVQVVPVVVPSPAAQAKVDEGSLGGMSLFTPLNLLIMFFAGLLAALLFVLRRRGGAGEGTAAFVSGGEEIAAGEEQSTGFGRSERRKSRITVPFERRAAAAGEHAAVRPKGAGEQGSKNGQSERAGGSRQAAGASASDGFGAYRVDQEVIRLVLGEPHSVEVLSSRVADDRRAVETSLLKALRAPEVDEDGRRRARTALEDYGFVARESATLLLGSDNYERVSAARALGDMRSAQALPFLTEALYDGDPVVRTEAVQSIGALGLPSAIGALLDIARRHPEIPATVLGPALTACSVESLELSWGSPGESRTFAYDGADGPLGGDFCGFGPASPVEELPEWIEDEALRVALERIGTPDAEARVQSAQALAQFQVRRAVEALTAMAVRDDNAAVRATAVTSLGLIDHESVFAPVIISMGDDAREVRAAAARALSRLSFERSDAYARVAETADDAIVTEVADACVRAGLAAQAINRLASEDRRQAYEAFALLSLVVKAGLTRPLLDAVENHTDVEVRLAAVRVAGLICQPELLRQLQELAAHGALPEEVLCAVHDVLTRAGEKQPEMAG